MNSFLAAAMVFACLFGAVLLGMSLRRLLPEHHLSADTKETATLALVMAVLAVSGAIFLILELDQPFGGLIQISSEPMLNALSHLAK